MRALQEIRDNCEEFIWQPDDHLLLVSDADSDVPYVLKVLEQVQGEDEASLYVMIADAFIDADSYAKMVAERCVALYAIANEERAQRDEPLGAKPRVEHGGIGGSRCRHHVVAVGQRPEAALHGVERVEKIGFGSDRHRRLLNDHFSQVVAGVRLTGRTRMHRPDVGSGKNLTSARVWIVVRIAMPNGLVARRLRAVFLGCLAGVRLGTSSGLGIGRTGIFERGGDGLGTHSRLRVAHRQCCRVRQR